MPSYKLVYFKYYGNAEAIRWIFKYLDIPFENVEIDYFKDWKPNELKEKYPYGKLPTLYIDDDKFIHSCPVILQYIAKDHGLLPEDPYDRAICQEVVDAWRDFMLPLEPYYYAILEDRCDDAKKIIDDAEKNSFPLLAKTLEQRLQGKEYVTGSKISWVDFYLAQMAGVLETFKEGILDPHPNLKDLTRKIENLPAIAKWLKERPQYQF